MASTGEQQLSIHQLLCKKVAQLTKVVYQLNVKSEDRDIDLNLIAKSYEAQIDQMATDNEQKVRQVQEQFRKHQQDLEAEVTKLLGDIKRLEKEKMQFLSKMNEYKKENEERMTRFKDVTKQRIDQLILEVDALRRDNVDDVRNSRKAAKDELARVSAELRGQNEALAAQLSQMTAARDRLQKELDAVRADLDKSTRDVDDLKQQLNAALKDKLSLSDVTQKKIAALEKQLEEARSQSLNSGDQINKLVKRIDSLEAELKTAQANYKQEVSTSTELKKEIAQLKTEIANWKQASDEHAAGSRELEKKLRELETRCAGLDKAVGEKDLLLKQLQQDKSQLNTEIDGLRKRIEDLQSKSTASSESERKLQLSLENATKEASFFRTQLSDANAKIDELKMQLAAERTAKEKAQTELTAASAQVVKLETELQRLRDEFITAQSSESNKYNQLEAKLRTLIQELEQSLVEEKINHEKALQAQRDTHEAESAALKAHISDQEKLHQEKVERLEQKISELETELSKSLSGLSSAQELNASLMQKTQDEIEALKTKVMKYKLLVDSIQVEIKQFCGSTKETCKLLLDALELSQRDISSLLDSQAETILLRVSQYITSMRNEADSSNTMKREYEELVGGLRRQIDGLNAELGKKTEQTATLTSEIENLKQLLENYRLELGSVRSDLDCKVRELAEITQRYQDEIRKADLSSKEIKELSKKIKCLEEQIAEMENTLGSTLNTTSAEAIQLKKQITELEARLAREMEAGHKLAAEKDQQIDTMKSELKSAQEKYLSRDREYKDLMEKLNITIADNNARTALLQKEHDEQLAKEQEKIKKLSDENLLLSGELERSKQALASLTDMHEKEIRALRKELAINQEALESMRESQRLSHEKIQGLEARLQHVTADAGRKLDEEFRKHQEALAALKKEHQEKINSLISEYEGRLTSANEQLAQAMAEAEKSRNELLFEIEGLKAEFKNRPSRLEDVELINQLRALLDKREQELDAAAKAVAYYKRELLAREESYNKRFHKENSRVGTMQIPGVPAHAMNAQQNSIVGNMIGAPLGTAGLSAGGVPMGSFSQTGPLTGRVSKGSASPKAKRPLSNNGLGPKGAIGPISMPKHLPAPL
ncbi:Coiled-coil protein [Giardia duodenalis]|uniref:Coiled-coil protein n=1 Tax=Giardia intestinalis (strain ATCC 50803 / WB clone C6) TaxID=184922 RepID=A8BQF9_GIAIC|nr:Coiled-coil protein [Giardia intestinalis]KAE8302017.1 Coiled-coil protein [Giardia intestinalis]|eukprot:XP_001705515.1 Coiled-coil protein [Giardia lamblia ATCC 50803]